MVIKNNSSTIALRRSIIALALLLLAIGYSIIVLEKTRVTDFYTKPASTDTTFASDARPVNTVEYTPATTSETDEADRIKAAAQAQLNATPTPLGDKIDVSFSAAGQDTKGGPIIVRAIVGASGGQCKLVISNTSTSKDFIAEVINMGTYYGCKGFDIPITDLTAGTYQATLSVTNGSATGSATQQIEVAK